MKKLFTLKIFLIILLSSCNDDNIEGRGEDPQLNISTYQFKKEGESIDVFSKINKPLLIYYAPSYNQEDEEPTITEDEYRGGIKSINGSWYNVSIDRKNDYLIKIEVSPNNTGKERRVPIHIRGMNHPTKTEYIQQ